MIFGISSSAHFHDDYAMKLTEYSVYYTIAVQFLSELCFFFKKETFIFLSIQYTR